MSYMSLQQLLAAQQGALIDSNNNNIADVLSGNLNSIDTDIQSLDGKFEDSNNDNITEVIKAGLASIAGALGETAEDVIYDNTSSGMAATNVQDAIDEIDTTIKAMDYTDASTPGSYVTEVDETDGVIAVTRESADVTPTDSSTKLVTSGGVYTALGTKQNTLTAGDGIDITSDVISVDAEEKTTTSTFNTVNGGLLSSCVVTLEPVQSGSGTPSPNNIRPITGHTTADIEITDGVDTDTYSTPLNQTVYGGTVDLVSGELTIDRVMETITSMSYYGLYGDDNAPLFYANLSNQYAVYTNVTMTSTKPISNAYVANTALTYDAMGDGEMRTQASGTYTYRFYFRDDRFTSKTDMDNWLANNPVQIVGYLYTPITVQLSKQQIKALIGSNTITAPLTGQSVSASYREVMGYDSVEQSIEIKVSLSSLGTVEDSNLSSQAYSSGDYFVRNGQMCKATTAIASGATLAEGTNYASYTMAEVLALLSSSTSHSYSTTEQIVGTWIDGKILYERTWTNLAVAITANTWASTGISATNIDTIVDGTMQDDNNQKIGGTIGFVSSHAYVGVYPNIGNRDLNTLTIQYTKV